MAIDVFVQKKLKSLRDTHKYTLEQLAKKLDTTAITLSRYENGKRSVSLCILEEICAVYNLTIPMFFSDKVFPKNLELKGATPVEHESVYIYGEIAAGNFSSMDLNYLDTIDIPSALAKKYGSANLFGLSINGESMNRIVQNNDYVVLNRQSQANNGDIVAVSINGEEATIKKFYKLDDFSIILKPESNDTSFEPIHIDLRNDPNIQILGRLVWHCSSGIN